MLHFSLIFIAIHSIIILSQPDLYQIITYFLYSLVHSIVNLNKDRGEAEHKKHENILKTHLIVFPCFLWMFIRGPVDTRGMNMLPVTLDRGLNVWSWQSLYDLSRQGFSTSIVRSNVHCFALLNAGWAKAQYMSIWVFLHSYGYFCNFWLRLELAKLIWSFAQVVLDVYREV